MSETVDIGDIQTELHSTQGHPISYIQLQK